MTRRRDSVLVPGERLHERALPVVAAREWSMDLRRVVMAVGLIGSAALSVSGCGSITSEKLGEILDGGGSRPLDTETVAAGLKIACTRRHQDTSIHNLKQSPCGCQAAPQELRGKR